MTYSVYKHKVRLKGALKDLFVYSLINFSQNTKQRITDIAKSYTKNEFRHMSDKNGQLNIKLQGQEKTDIITLKNNLIKDNYQIRVNKRHLEERADQRSFLTSENIKNYIKQADRITKGIYKGKNHCSYTLALSTDRQSQRFPVFFETDNRNFGVVAITYFKSKGEGATQTETAFKQALKNKEIKAYEEKFLNYFKNK